MTAQNDAGPEAVARPEAAKNVNGSPKVAARDDPRQHVARIPRRRGEELRVGIAEYRGRNYADVRAWYLDDADEWRPGRGVTVPPALWPAFCAAVVELDGRLRAAGIVTDEEGGGDG